MKVIVASCENVYKFLNDYPEVLGDAMKQMNKKKIGEIETEFLGTTVKFSMKTFPDAEYERLKPILDWVKSSIRDDSNHAFYCFTSK